MATKKNKLKRQKQQQKQQFLFEKDYTRRLQEVLYTSEHILSKIFRKDGPPLGDQFDSLPPHAFQHCHKKDSKNVHRACQEHQRAFKKRKLCTPAIDHQTCREMNTPVEKHGIGKGLMTVKGAIGRTHGIGKGLMTGNSGPIREHGVGKGMMTVWRVTNPDAGDLPNEIGYDDRRPKEKKKKTQRRQPVAKKIVNKSLDKRKASLRSRKVQIQKVENGKRPWKEKCELGLEGVQCQEDRNNFALLVDDEELELQELQAGPNPLICSAHLTTNGLHGCPLCKDLLGKFPPNSVTMRLPLCKQPWDSSPELVKRLFKVFHFLCTYAVKINISSFTLDEFAQAFLDKDSLLLGQVHVALLKLLLSDIEQERCRGSFLHANKNSKFLGLLHSVENQELVLEFWNKSLNPLTWAEILYQVLVAAGYGSKLGTSLVKTLNKEVSLMEKYGLKPGTLKGELFCLLLTQGSSGMKVSELAMSSPIVDLDLPPTTLELETLISSTLATDITLFEKISSSGYRLRVNPSTLESEICGSESEGFGSVHGNSEVSGRHNSSDDSECESGESSPANVKRSSQSKSKDNMLTVYTEIDESNPGEAWLLGLMEGEYSDLNIEEKLTALAALVDLLSAGSSIRKEDSMTSIKEFVPNIYHQSSGAKIKRSTVQQYNSSRHLEGYGGQMLYTKDANSLSVPHPIDSFVCISTICQIENSSTTVTVTKEKEAGFNSHPMQSIFLGSDRRYNQYWLFLGPCDETDPGHKRIYFESSEDGHWEVIDTEEALCTLLSALDHRGAREAFLLASLEKRVAFLCRAMSTMPDGARIRQSSSDLSELNVSREDSSSAVSDVDNLGLTDMQNNLPSSNSAVTNEFLKKEEQQKDTWDRVQAFDAWVWKTFYSELNAVKHGKRSYLDSLSKCGSCHDLYWRDEKHCRSCHTTFELDFDLEEKYAIHTATCRVNNSGGKFPRHEVLSSQLQSLKAAIYAIESVMPDEALGGAWKKSAHNLWVKRLRRASTLTEFLQVLADFVSAVSEDWLYQFHNAPSSSYVLEDILTSFPAMPQTTSAIGLWLVKLDMLVAPHLEKNLSQDKLEPATRSKGKRASNRNQHRNQQEVSYICLE